MKKIMGIFILLALITPLFLQQIKAAEFSAVDVNITYQYDSENSSSEVLTDKAYGSYVDFQPVTNPSYSFAVWVVNGVVRPDLPESASIKVTSNMNIIGLYAPVGEYGVLFIDTNGQIIDKQYVVSGGTAVPPTNALPNKPGLEVKSEAWVSDQGLTTFDNVLENRIYTLQYQSSSLDTYDLYIDNVLYSAFPYNDLVTVTADAVVEGVPFAYWSLNGYAVSSDLEYTFTILEDTNLTKVYENGFEVQPMLTISGDLGIRSGYQSFMAQFYLPSGYELVEWGFLYSSDNTADLTIGAEGTNQAQSNQYNPATNEYLMSFSLGFLNAINAYMFYDDGVSVHVMYSELTERFNSNYSTGFEFSEGYTSGTYYQNTVLNSQKEWDIFYGAYSTTSPINGSISAQMRYYGDTNFGYMESNVTFTNPSSVSFYAKNSDNISVAVSVSYDRLNWIDTEIFTLSTTASQYEYNVLSIGDLYFRFDLIVDSGTSGKLYLDDIYIVDNSIQDVNLIDLVQFKDITKEIAISQQPMSEPTPEVVEGYSFDAWYADQSFTTLFDFDSVITSDIAIFGQWLINQYTVSFDSNGGSAVASITDDYGTDISDFSEQPTKTGYNFTGWYSDLGLTTLYTFDTIPGSDITLYAGWSPIEYSITYNLDGGTNHELNPATYTIEDEVNLLAASRDGYVFVGWYDAASSGEEVTLITNQTGNVVLYAYWTVASGTEYTVSFVTNGDAISSQTVAESNYAVEPSPTFTGHWLDGYYTDALFTTPFDFATDAINSDLTIYLKWQQNASDLFFSEYIEGSSNNKALEIYNGTGSAVDLSNYTVKIYFNGATTASGSISLSGTLENNDVFVIANSSANSSILSVTDLTSGSLTFNGDDTVQLLNGTTSIDVIGQIGLDPGTEWNSSTADNTIVRNSDIVSGDSDGSDAFDPTIEWTVFSIDTISNLGSHEYNPGE
ncbi:MAG: InlB B-repeat-containing protein [Acholeplasmataceae bacterium]